MTEIFDGISALVEFPYQGHTLPKLTSRNLRFKAVREYVIADARKRNLYGLWRCSMDGGARE
jgi:hypothetical protein